MLSYLAADPFASGAATFVILSLIFLMVRDQVRKARTGGIYSSEMRLKSYRDTTLLLWVMASVVTIGWFASGREAAAFGLRHEASLGLFAAWGLVLLVAAYGVYQIFVVMTSAQARDQLANQLGPQGEVGLVAPQGKGEFAPFFGLAVTAGITEEIIFRSFAIGFLATWMPIWVAGALSVAIFVLGHSYQGLSGMLRILPIAVILTLVYLMSGSIYPAIVLHVLVDILSGLTFWAFWRAGGAHSGESPPPVDATSDA